MKYICIDYGTKRVGVALSDAAGTIAFPRATYPNDARLLERLTELVEDEAVDTVVVGDTRSHGGAGNPVTPEAESFMGALGRTTGKTVIRAFEVFSSVEASRHAPPGKGHDDAAAAAVILQRFLDMRGKQ